MLLEATGYYGAVYMGVTGIYGLALAFSVSCTAEEEEKLKEMGSASSRTDIKVKAGLLSVVAIFASYFLYNMMSEGGGLGQRTAAALGFHDEENAGYLQGSLPNASGEQNPAAQANRNVGGVLGANFLVSALGAGYLYAEIISPLKACKAEQQRAEGFQRAAGGGVSTTYTVASVAETGWMAMTGVMAALLMASFYYNYRAKRLDLAARDPEEYAWRQDQNAKFPGLEMPARIHRHLRKAWEESKKDSAEVSEPPAEPAPTPPRAATPVPFVPPAPPVPFAPQLYRPPQHPGWGFHPPAPVLHRPPGAPNFAPNLHPHHPHFTLAPNLARPHPGFPVPGPPPR